MADRFVLFIYESWKNLDESVAGLTREETTARHFGGSSVAWTIGHVTTMVDSWINTNFQGLPPHPFLVGDRFRNGGTGECDDWEGVLAATDDVRRSARDCIWTRSRRSTRLSHTPGRLSSFEEPACD